MFGSSKQKPGAKINRSEVLAAADKLRVKGKYAKAVVEYRKVLALDAADADVLAKIAPLLVKLGKRAEALHNFHAAADSYIQRGFVDRAVAVHTQAAAAYPHEISLWETLARLHNERGRRADGIKALLTGASHFKGKRGRPAALKLLRQALAYDSMHIDATIGLARLLKANGERQAARTLLDELSGGIRGPARKRVLGARFKLFPGPVSFFRWLRA